MCKSIRFELFFNYLMLLLLACGMAGVTVKLFILNGSSFSLSVCGLFAALLFYSGLVHLLARHGYYKRLDLHAPVKKEVLEKFFIEKAPSLIILLPSYKEEIAVIRQSLYSSALQSYPNRRVTLLIDNPPNCALLAETKAIVKEINGILQKQHQIIASNIQAFYTRIQNNFDLEIETVMLAKLYDEIANWFFMQAENYPERDHTDKVFVELTFRQRAHEFQYKRHLTEDAIKRAWSLLGSLFQVEITSFERKKYHNFSHASNKSMNLNSYISVLGKHFKESKHEGQLILQECIAEEAECYFPTSEYISVLDADSVLTFDYASRLIYEMEQPEFAKTAVMQTPYSAFPKAPGILEKMAGATTDIQYMIHQGFTYFGATFWVGANALIRKSALDDIVQHKLENNFLISRYVQDRTVIEDTESSIDLAAKGWELHNFPDRLSYSATPPDFGSLLIQRKRWANGGLIILPKALAYLKNNKFSWSAIKECFFRIHYLISIPAFLLCYVLMPFSTLSLSEFPLEGALLTCPYLIIYSRDLKLMGYRFTDIFRVIALNTLLIPVNLAGVLQSFTQIIFGKHTPFFRTPKISGLTPIPLIYLLMFLLLGIHSVTKAITTNGLIDCTLALLLIYGCVKYLSLHTVLRKQSA